MARAYMRNVSTSAIIEVEKDSREYKKRSKEKTADGRFPLYEEVNEEVAGEAAGDHTVILQVTVPGAAIGASYDQAIGESPFKGTVVAASIIPEAAITGQATNFRRLRVVNKGQAGAGTAITSEYAFDAAGKNAVAFDELALTLDATLANRNVEAGDVLAFVSDAVGTGLVDPGGVVQVEVARRA